MLQEVLKGVVEVQEDMVENVQVVVVVEVQASYLAS